MLQTALVVLLMLLVLGARAPIGPLDEKVKLNRQKVAGFVKGLENCLG